jgi:hypothetical protein
MSDYQEMGKEGGEPEEDLQNQIYWPDIPKAHSTFSVINAETLRHPRMYSILYVFTLIFQLFGSVIMVLSSYEERNGRKRDYGLWCEDPEARRGNKEWLLAANKLTASLGTGMCCVNEITEMTDALTQGIFMRPDLQTKAKLFLHSILHFLSVVLIFTATLEVEYYETTSIDVYLNAVGLIFIFEIKHQAAQAFNMRMITFEMHERNAENLNLLRASRLRHITAVQTARNFDENLTGGL